MTKFDNDTAELNHVLLRASSLVERDPQAAVAYALVAIGRELAAITTQLTAIRNELKATRHPRNACP